MNIEYDDAKDAANIEKHGISLAFAALLFEEDYKEMPDNRQDYGERRMIASGFIEGRLFVCVYTWRGRRRRIISLRKANGRERDAYREK